jgi:sarcosine oxidase subunit beta
VFRNWSEIVGGDCGFESPGFVQVVAPEYERQLRANVAEHQALGINTRVITPDELLEIEPSARVDDVVVAAYEPDSGFADPNATLYGFVKAASDLGVRVRTGVAATALLTEGDRISGVETTSGTISTRTVVLIPGPWAQPLLAPLGLEFDLEPRRVQVAVFRWPFGFERRHPIFIDDTQAAWFRPEGANGTLVGLESGVDGVDPDRITEGVDHDYVEQCRAALAYRMPVFERATMRGGWAGVITMSPDGRPIIDQIPQVTGLFCMLGDSGTSFKTAPAIGKGLAEWVTAGEPQSLDLRPFRSTRFADGDLWLDANAYGPHRERTISR